MPGTLEAFTRGGNTVTISATGASASIAYTSGLSHLLVSNATTQWAFFNTGEGSATATVAGASTPIAPGAQAVVSVPPSHNTVAAILVSGSGSVYFTPGYGT